jgi:hypothetical protein
MTRSVERTGTGRITLHQPSKAALVVRSREALLEAVIEAGPAGRATTPIQRRRSMRSPDPRWMAPIRSPRLIGSVEEGRCEREWSEVVDESWERWSDERPWSALHTPPRKHSRTSTAPPRVIRTRDPPRRRGPRRTQGSEEHRQRTAVPIQTFSGDTNENY